MEVQEKIKIVLMETWEQLDGEDKTEAYGFMRYLLSNPKYTRKQRITVTTNERTCNND